MSTIFNSRKSEFKTPFGAVKVAQTVRFTLRLPENLEVSAPALLLEKDGEQPQKYCLEAKGKQDGCDVFTVEFSVQSAGIYFYWFDLWVDYQKLFCGANGEAYLTKDNGEKYALCVYNADFETPSDVHGGVMYQIFPDRFLEGNPEKDLMYSERVYRHDKHNPPYFWGTENGQGGLTQDYYGGDLLGIEKRLGYLKALGVTWIYLNPIFEAHANHHYNTADYLKVDPYLGTNEDFERLCEKAKALGIGIILDGVFSHTGSDSIYFNKECRYPTVGAWQGPASPYRDWYNFLPDGNYKSWWGFDTLPECNKQNEDYRNFITGEGGVVDFWLKLGASGFRLDVADELPDDFIALIRTAVKRNGKDKLLIGEVWEDAALKVAYGLRRKYFLGEELDGVMNYPFRTAILDFLQNGNGEAFEETVMRICEHYPAPALAACTTHISTHDTVRAITALAGDSPDGHDRNWQSGRMLSREQYQLGILRMRLAFVLQFILPGVPCIYYGDEIAMQGYADPFNRAYFDWSSSENRLIPLVMKLSAFRQACVSFNMGDISFIKERPGMLHIKRGLGDDSAEIFINASAIPAHVMMQGKTVNVPAMDFRIFAKGYEFGE